MDSPSHRSTFRKDCRVSQRICDKVIQNVREGTTVYIDLNTQTNFRKGRKMPRVHFRSDTQEHANNIDSTEDLANRLTTQLSRDMDSICLKKEKLRALLNGDRLRSLSNSIDSKKAHRPKLL